MLLVCHAIVSINAEHVFKEIDDSVLLRARLAALERVLELQEEAIAQQPCAGGVMHDRLLTRHVQERSI